MIVLDAVLDSSLTAGLVPITVYAIALAVLIAVCWRRPVRGWAIRYGIAGLLGLALGFGLAWYLGDVRDAFGVTLTLSTRAWFAIGVAGAAICLMALWRARPRRIILAVVGVVLFALVAGVGINSTIGEFPTVRSALGLDELHQLPPLPARASGTGASGTDASGTDASASRIPVWRSWKAPAGLSMHGRYGTEHIRGTVSHFVARDAIVYLPPAALVRDAPALPVMVFLSGQPASPQTVVGSGELPQLMNRFAAAHHGLAPIVVIPDQLGQSAANPMCLNSPLGNVATYLTVDVRHWILTHLHVLTDRADWTIGGFSEGGTCSIQLGTAYRSLFGNILDISGEVAPHNGSRAHTIEIAFHGSAAAYQRATPLHLLSAGAPFSSTDGVFVVGADDTKYGPQSATIEAAARAAGMHVRSSRSPGTAHDWYTVRYGLTFGVDALAQRMGLAR